jgi:uncharacterized membrane protein
MTHMVVVGTTVALVSGLRAVLPDVAGWLFFVGGVGGGNGRVRRPVAEQRRRRRRRWRHVTNAGGVMPEMTKAKAWVSAIAAVLIVAQSTLPLTEEWHNVIASAIAIANIFAVYGVPNKPVGPAAAGSQERLIR